MAESASLKITEPAPPGPSLRLLSEPSARPRRPTPRLEIPTYDFAAARRLEQDLGISHVLAQILVRRGMPDLAAARAFLRAEELHDPTAFDGIEEAMAVIRRHVAAGSRITVHGDYDVDGVCGTAVLVRALRSLGADADWFLPSRLEDGYGIGSPTVERLAARGTRLLVTVDCGITAVEQVAQAQALGLETVITDHHAPRPDGSLPAGAVVHPVVGGYPCPELCGTAVALKLAQALGAPTGDTDHDLVALATVADLMPLRGENRHLVRTGLRAMANTAKPGLQALMEVARVDPSALDAHALGFRLAPRINASGRLQRADAGLELLLTDDRRRAAEIAAELDAVNAERRAVEERTTWDAEAQVSRLGERSSYVLCGEGWHPGVIGIVASRIVERHHRPVILVALGEGPFGQGSGRSIPGFDLLRALHAAAPELERYGGHRAAAGLTVARERLPALTQAIEAHAASMLTPEKLEPVERVDAIVSGPELGLPMAEELRVLEPCGIGNPAPCLLIPGGRFSEQRPMGDGRHARFAVSSGGARARAVAFGCDGRLPGPGEAVDATFRLERNEWRGLVEPRLVLRHAEPCAPAPIDALGEPESFLEGVVTEVEAPLGGAELVEWAPGTATRTLLDRREESPLAALADAISSGERVLAICADVPRRLGGLSGRLGGFSLACYHALERRPELAEAAGHLVALDPPASAGHSRTLRAGRGITHLAWGEAELRFAWQMHELEYGLRASLVALFRSLRQRGRVAGEELEQLLRGDGQHGRPARLAGRLIRVLAELELVSLDRDPLALAVAGDAPTSLDRSPAYRAYEQRHKDGLRYLSNAKLRPDG